MAYRPLRTTDFSDQLALWEERPEPEALPAPAPVEPQRADTVPAPAARRPAAARRADAVSRSERALAAIRAMLAVPAESTR
ncbi:MAG: hypothetical protein N2544_05395 [Burkholderiales bacterium]|nr:hypothetical protein [Burkholderiales bacterium]